MKSYEAGAGEHIDQTIKNILRMAALGGTLVRTEFNGIELIATPRSTERDLKDYFHAEQERQAEEYRRSPEGVAAEKRARKFREQAAAAQAEGILPFTAIDSDGWQRVVDANTDEYGACGIRFAARWANYMEKQIATGATLADIAEQASHDADKEGITGFMYGCAVSVLARVWVHGEELRHWHNLKTQIGNEGERANKTGGTLNPALLNIG